MLSFLKRKNKKEDQRALIAELAEQELLEVYSSHLSEDLDEDDDLPSQGLRRRRPLKPVEADDDLEDDAASLEDIDDPDEEYEVRSVTSKPKRYGSHLSKTVSEDALVKTKIPDRKEEITSEKDYQLGLLDELAFDLPPTINQQDLIKMAKSATDPDAIEETSDGISSDSPSHSMEDLDLSDLYEPEPEEDSSDIFYSTLYDSPTETDTPDVKLNLPNNLEEIELLLRKHSNTEPVDSLDDLDLDLDIVDTPPINLDLPDQIGDFKHLNHPSDADDDLISPHHYDVNTTETSRDPVEEPSEAAVISDEPVIEPSSITPQLSLELSEPSESLSEQLVPSPAVVAKGSYDDYYDQLEDELDSRLLYVVSDNRDQFRKLSMDFADSEIFTVMQIVTSRALRDSLGDSSGLLVLTDHIPEALKEKIEKVVGFFSENPMGRHLVYVGLENPYDSIEVTLPYLEERWLIALLENRLIDYQEEIESIYLELFRERDTKDPETSDSSDFEPSVLDDLDVLSDSSFDSEPIKMVNKDLIVAENNIENISVDTVDETSKSEYAPEHETEHELKTEHEPKIEPVQSTTLNPTGAPAFKPLMKSYKLRKKLKLPTNETNKSEVETRMDTRPFTTTDPLDSSKGGTGNKIVYAPLFADDDFDVFDQDLPSKDTPRSPSPTSSRINFSPSVPTIRPAAPPKEPSDQSEIIPPPLMFQEPPVQPKQDGLREVEIYINNVPSHAGVYSELPTEALIVKMFGLVEDLKSKIESQTKLIQLTSSNQGVNVQEYEDKISSLESELHRVKSEVGAYLTALSKKEAELKGLSEELYVSQSDLSRMSSSLDSLQLEYNSLVKAYSLLQSNYDVCKGDLTRALSESVSWKSKYDNVNSQVLDIQRLNDTLRSQLDLERSQSSQLQTMLSLKSTTDLGLSYGGESLVPLHLTSAHPKVLYFRVINQPIHLDRVLGTIVSYVGNSHKVALVFLRELNHFSKLNYKTFKIADTFENLSPTDNTLVLSSRDQRSLKTISDHMAHFDFYIVVDYFCEQDYLYQGSSVVNIDCVRKDAEYKGYGLQGPVINDDQLSLIKFNKDGNAVRESIRNWVDSILHG